MAYHFNTAALREALAAERRTQQEAADAASIGLSAFKMKMRGERSVSLQEVVDIAGLLLVTPSSLIGHPDQATTTMELARTIGISPATYAEYCEAAAA